jgi:sarcosine oxidase subunit gamma
MARRGQWQATAEAAARLFGVSLPAGPRVVRANRSTLIWSGPDQFLALSNRSPNGSVLAAAQQFFPGIASLSDQSDGRALIRVSGPAARAMLAKLISLDLHPQAFPSGSAATTSIDHTGVNFWRGDDTDNGEPTFYVLLFSTFAESLWDTMLDAAAEYGLDINQESTAAWLV